MKEKTRFKYLMICTGALMAFGIMGFYHALSTQGEWYYYGVNIIFLSVSIYVILME